ncbi:MAG: hypothetical protein RIB67_11275 [Miltoncostaeaceae bacterium]
MTDRRTFTIRTAALGAGVVVVLGAGAAFAVDPFPASAGGDVGERIERIERRERVLAQRAERINERSARLWESYRVRLAARERQIARIRADNARVRSAAAGSTAAAARARAAAPAAVAYTPAAPVATSGSS